MFEFKLGNNKHEMIRNNYACFWDAELAHFLTNLYT